MKLPTLPIHERFNAFQGEGVHMGRSAFFVRTFGCPVKCPWCDSAGTWHKDWVPDHINRMTTEAIVAEIVEADPSMVVITGGEPTVHDLSDLARAIRNDTAATVHVETCGAFEYTRDTFDWVTLSPKWDRVPLAANIRSCSELKIIVDQEDSIDRWLSFLSLSIGSDVLELEKPIWLHPEWSQRNNPLILNKIAEMVKTHGGPLRAGWQLHKLYKVDALDDRAAKQAPLGGNPALGL